MNRGNFKDLVKDFWNRTPCGTREIQSEVGSQAFFDQLENNRNDREFFIKDFAKFSNHKGKKVLEVGMGAGTDFIRFARGGAILHGMDLTFNSVALVKKRLKLENRPAFLFQGDAEYLPFPNGFLVLFIPGELFIILKRLKRQSMKLSESQKMMERYA